MCCVIVTAITRSNPTKGHRKIIGQINKYNGIKMVEIALNSGCEKIVNETIFLYLALCNITENIRGKCKSKIYSWILKVEFVYSL